MNILAIPFWHGLSKPVSGGQSRFFHISQELKEKGNNIIIYQSKTYTSSEDKKFAKIYTYSDCRIFNRGLFTIFRDIDFLFILNLYLIIKKEKVDVVQFTYPSGVLATRLIVRLTRTNVLVVYDAQNVEAEFIEEVFANNPRYSKFERIAIPSYIRMLEGIVCKYCIDHMTSVSDRDKNQFIGRYHLNEDKITVVPSGCRIIEPIEIKEKAIIKKEFLIPQDTKIIIFHGSYSHIPNKEAFEIIYYRIAPQFENGFKDVLFITFGTGLPKFKKNNVISLGQVEDIHALISAADIAIAPLRKGAGTKLKVLDYLGAGLPIVTTTKGIEGINVENGVHAIITCDVDDNFLRSIKYLLLHDSERKKFSINASNLAKDQYTWEKIGEKIDNAYRNL